MYACHHAEEKFKLVNGSEKSSFFHEGNALKMFDNFDNDLTHLVMYPRKLRQNILKRASRL